MSTPQEYWDACLIKTWRQAEQVLHTIQMFEAVTGIAFKDAQLLRAPRLSYPWKTGVRVFVAAHLPKINDRLWNQPPEKDALLLRKLATSSYTATEQNTNPDKELAAAQKLHRQDKKRLSFGHNAYTDRNQATDWKVTKGPVRTRRAK